MEESGGLASKGTGIVTNTYGNGVGNTVKHYYAGSNKSSIKKTKGK